MRPAESGSVARDRGDDAILWHAEFIPIGISLLWPTALLAIAMAIEPDPRVLSVLENVPADCPEMRHIFRAATAISSLRFAALVPARSPAESEKFGFDFVVRDS